MMRIAVLDLTEQPDLLAGLPRVSDQIVAWLSPALPEATYLTHDIVNDAPMPALDSFDGLVLSGSEYGVYDQTRWMDDLRALLLATRAAGKPIYGICFGHQIMADTFGGKAEKADTGYAIGIHTFEHAGDEVQAHAWHQDQVTQLPPNARITGRAAHCPIGSIDYDFPARSVQFHPEYTEEHLRDLFARGRDIFITGAQVDRAIETFERATVPIDLLAQETASFFRQHIAQATPV